MFEIKFLQAVAERAVKTFMQTLLALLGTNAAGVLTVDMLPAVEVAASATLLSVLTSFASSGVGKTGPSLAGETTAEPKIITVEVPVEVPAPAKPKTAAAKKAAPAKKPAAPKTK